MSLRRLGVVARDELRYTVRRPMVWILLVLLVLITWGLSSGNVQIIIASGDATVGGKKAWLTSEFALSQILAITSFLFYLFFASAAAGLTVIRDAEAGVLEILQATPLRPSEYVWGKFLGVLGGFLAVLALHVAILILILQVLPNADMLDTRGPFALGNYLHPTLLFALPVIVFAAGTAFGVGTATRRAILVFVLPVALTLLAGFFLWSWSPSWLDPRINRLLMAIDPGGVRWLSEMWLKVDRGADFYNTQPVRPDLLLIANRLVMLTVALGAVALGGRRFARLARGEQAVSTDDVSRALAAPPIASVPVMAASAPRLATRVARVGFWASAWKIARAEGRELRSQPGLYLFIPIILLEILGDSLTALGPFDTPLLLVPGDLAVGQMQMQVSYVALLLIFYAVESLTRERSTRLSAIQDATPVSNGAIVTGKVMALGVLWAIIAGACLVASLVAILIQGRVSFSVWPFALVWGLILLPSYLVWTAFIFAVFAITRSRFTTYGVAVATFALTIFEAVRGKLTWLWNWPLWNAMRWSDMSVFEFDRSALILNRLLMLGFAALLFRIAIRLYPRRDRDVTRSLHAFAPRAMWGTVRRAWAVVVPTAIVFSLLWHQIAIGPDGPQADRMAKNYWKKNLATWKDTRIPWLKHADLQVELEPAQRRWSVRGSYLIVNQLDSTIQQVPITVGRWDDMSWTLDGTPYTPDTASHLFVFTTPHPLNRGDSVRIGFTYVGTERGSTKRGGGASEFVVPSGVVMTGFSPRYFPYLGYVEGIGVERDKNQYEPRQYPDRWYEGVTPPVFGSQRPQTVRMQVTAPADFTVNGVGELVEQHVSGGRRTDVWESDQPVMAFNLVAAKAQERRGTGTALFYHPAHSYNIDEMIQALDAARHWYGEWYGAFPWKELKITEFPNLASYAQGFPTNISFSEGIGFLTKSDRKTNLAFMVTAHESAHQWWGNLVQPGVGPSGNFLSEGMAHFSTALLLEQVKGAHAAMEFRQRIESQYGDQRHADAERKMYRVDGSKDGDNTLWYNKGGWVFWMLADRMGRQNALRGMKDFVTKYYGNPDHPVLYDFTDHMRRYASDTAAYNDFVKQWFDSVVVPEYRVRDVKRTRVDSDGTSWETSATIENAGTGRMPVEVAVSRGVRFPNDSSATKADSTRYADARVTITLDGGANQRVVIRSAFEPEQVVVDPDVRVLQLRRKSAMAKIPR